MTELEMYTAISTAIESSGSVHVMTVDLQGFGNSGDTDNCEQHPKIEVLQQYGIYSRPESGQNVEAPCVYYKESMVSLPLIDKTAVDISSLEEGEIRLQNRAGAVVRLRADGSIELTPASGKNIILDGGSAKVSRVGDRTTGHSHTATFALNAGATPVTGTITISTETDTMNEGAARVKA